MSQMPRLGTHNGTTHDNEKGSVHVEEHASHQPFSQSPIQLTAAQYERLFFQPGGGPRKGDLSNPKQFGNPTAFAIISYLLALTPTVCILMSWDGTAPTSLTSIIGDFYFIGGLGMTIGGVFEWVGSSDVLNLFCHLTDTHVQVLGNTFPFGTFYYILTSFFLSHINSGVLDFRWILVGVNKILSWRLWLFYLFFQQAQPWSSL
jgi:hypothetical protein